jgi:hypothetical protein
MNFCCSTPHKGTTLLTPPTHSADPPPRSASVPGTTRGPDAALRAYDGAARMPRSALAALALLSGVIHAIIGRITLIKTMRYTHNLYYLKIE